MLSSSDFPDFKFCNTTVKHRHFFCFLSVAIYLLLLFSSPCGLASPRGRRGSLLTLSPRLHNLFTRSRFTPSPYLLRFGLWASVLFCLFVQTGFTVSFACSYKTGYTLHPPLLTPPFWRLDGGLPTTPLVAPPPLPGLASLVAAIRALDFRLG
jgi:hypothetical protein